MKLSPACTGLPAAPREAEGGDAGRAENPGSIRAGPPSPAEGAGGAPGERRPLSPEASGAVRRFLVLLAFATLACAGAWRDLIRDAWNDALHSYTVAIPAICIWLLAQDRKCLVGVPLRPAGGPAIAVGLLAAGAWTASRVVGIEPGRWALTLEMLGWVFAVWGAILVSFGWVWIRTVGFAVGFLLVTVPLPVPAVHGIEQGLQHATAAVIEWVFRIADVTYSRDAKAFWLDGLRFEVARECSGIRSTLMLFVTSLVGVKILLRTASRRTLLALAVIPLGVARNAFRICVITLLSIHVDPRIIDSPLHHRGGPLFFGLSLVPLLLLFWWFRRQEAAARRRPVPATGFPPEL